MKVLISSDIHIDDYSDYNFLYRSRLAQFDLLAERLVEMGKEHNCEEIWLLGDIINKPYSNHHVNHCLKRFLTRVLSEFKVGRFVLGQHDMSCKVNDQSKEDTIITLLDYDNFLYMDHKVLELDGHKFGFMNWKPDQDLSWLTDKVDILLGHYTKSNLFGQEIDESKFDLMIHGDIHNDRVIGKFVSVGNPIQHDLKSLENGSCILLDTETLEWTRLRTDEDHKRFLRIKYTSNREEEGFISPLQYNVYKPAIESSQELGQEKSIEWSDIDELIVNFCKEYNILEVHGKVESQCEPFSEIDFNFQIDYLKIHGYRSIEDMELHFNRGDRISLIGDNGSGKTSILTALSGVFGKNSDLKYNQSDFCDDIQVTVRLTYQNKKYEITKGTTWNFTVEGEVQHYGGVREFESDIIEKLPFLNYLDLFFLHSNVNNLAVQFTPTRRIDLISKFYRLDRIQAYRRTCEKLYNSETEKWNALSKDLGQKSEVVSYLKKRISELDHVKDLNESELNAKLDELIRLKEQYSEFTLWETKHKSLLKSKSDIENQMKVVEAQLSNDIESDKKDLLDFKNRAEYINSAYEKLYKVSVEFESDLKEILSLERSGKELNSKLETLKSGVCPECGSRLGDHKHRDLIQSYESKLVELRSSWSNLDHKMSTHEKGRDSKEFYIGMLRKLKEEYSEINKSIEILSNKVNSYELLKSQLDSLNKNLESIEVEITAHLDVKVEKPTIPIDSRQLEEDYRSKLNLISELKRLHVDLEDKEGEIQAINDQIEVIRNTQQKYSKYIELVSNEGILFEEILRKLAVKFSTDKVKYEVESGIYRGSRFIRFNPYYKVKTSYRIYEGCSDGQKSVCDFDFLDKLFSVQVGLLCLDESLKSVDGSNFSKICESLMEMNVNTILISTHDINMNQYTKRFMLSLDENEKTKINIS